MRLEKKTMATLLAAILIAIAGVMPALAGETDSVTLTVEVVPIISINIIEESVDFGTPGPGDQVIKTVIIVNDGHFDVDVTAVVTGAFFLANLDVSGTYTFIARGEAGNADLILNVPTEATADTYTGSILFTASVPS